MNNKIFSFFLAISLITISCNNFKEYSEIEFIRGTVDFGTITMNDTLSHTFLLKNSSKIDLQIIGYNASCGCTTMIETDSIIKPNDTARIKVRLIPDKIGLSEKTIVLEANTNPPFNILQLKGNIER